MFLLEGLLLVFLGCITVWAQSYWDIPEEFSVALYGTSMVAVLVVLALRTVRVLDELEARQRSLVQERAAEFTAREETLRRLLESEERLLVNERRFRQIFNSTFNFIGLLTPEGIILEANDTALNLIGVAPSEVLGRPFADTPWWSHSKEEQAKLREAILRASTGTTVRFETSHPDASGGLRFVDFTLKPVLNAMGNVVHLVPEGRDITERKQAEAALLESQARYHSLFENMLEGFAYCRLLYEQGEPSDYVYLEVNTTFERLTGLKGVIGRKVSEVVPGIHTSNPEQLQLYAEVASSGKPLRFETFAKPMGIWFSVSVYSYEPGHFAVVFDNITQRKMNEEALKDAARRLQLATQASSTGVWDWDIATNKIVWDDMMFKLYGLPSSMEVRYDTWARAVLPEDLAEQESVLQKTVQRSGGSEREFRIIRANDGEIRVIYAAEMTLTDSEGKALRIIGVNRDVTEQKNSAALLAASEALLRQFIKHTPAAIAMLDTNLCYVQTSDQWLRDYHIDNQEIIGRSHYEVFPDIPERWREIHQRVLMGEVESCNEDPFPRADGSIEWLQWEARPWRKSGGEIGGLIFFTQVITERKLAEARLQSSLEEKEVLLREIHHRVKNNMQVVISLLQLHSSYIKDARDAEIFKECQSRVHAMALVHDRLYRSGNLATIDFADHLKELTKLIVRGHSNEFGRIRLKVESESLHVDLERAIPLGLIATELITNAYKHAFKQGVSGNICVRLMKLQDSRVLLVVEDDGGGLPAGLEWEKSRSLGMRLMRALCNQLRGEFCIDSSNRGSKISVRFLI